MYHLLYSPKFAKMKLRRRMAKVNEKQKQNEIDVSPFGRHSKATRELGDLMEELIIDQCNHMVKGWKKWLNKSCLRRGMRRKRMNQQSNKKIRDGFVLTLEGARIYVPLNKI